MIASKSLNINIRDGSIYTGGYANDKEEGRGKKRRVKQTISNEQMRKK